MNNKELAAELTKAYIQALVPSVLADQAPLPSKAVLIPPNTFTEAYKQFYNLLSSIPDEK